MEEGDADEVVHADRGSVDADESDGLRDMQLAFLLECPVLIEEVDERDGAEAREEEGVLFGHADDVDEPPQSNEFDCSTRASGSDEERSLSDVLTNDGMLYHFLHARHGSNSRRSTREYQYI